MADRYGGCGCCCVDLRVDDDQTTLWEKDTTTPGETTVTILRAVRLCNFMFGFEAVLNGAALSGDGTAYIYLLDDPTDANVDAVGEIRFESNYDKDGVLNKPFWAAPETDNFVYNNPFPSGDGEVDITDLGIIAGTFDHSDYGNGLSIGTWGDKFLLTSDYKVVSNELSFDWLGFPCWNGTGTTQATLDNLANVMMFDRDTCTDTGQQVYIRYRVTGDYTLPDVKFALQSINTIGDRSCRTDSSYYTADTEEGSCISVPDNCTIYPTERRPFLEVEVYIPDQGHDGSTGNFTQTFYYINTGATDSGKPANDFCSMELNGTWQWSSDDRTDIASVEWIFESDAWHTCESGVNTLTLNFRFRLQGGLQPTNTWEIELDYDVTKPQDIPLTVLNESNRSDSNTYPTGATLTINP